MYPKPVPRTHLTLERYAAILGIDPWHFQGAYGDNVHPVKGHGCNDLWPQNSYQNGDQVSRYDLAVAIKTAEGLLEQFVKYPLAPTYINEEVRGYPKHYRPTAIATTGLKPDGSSKALNVRWNKLLRAGRRATEEIELGATVVYSDEDSDDIFETATITVATTVTDPNEIRLFRDGENAHPSWEYRWPRSISISGGTATIVIDSWHLVDPSLQNWAPSISNSVEGIRVDTGDASKFVSTVDVYRVYTDTTSPSATLYWEPRRGVEGVLFTGSCPSCSGSGCPACSYTAQDGCAFIHNHESGLIAAVPAVYDSDDGRWEQTTLLECREPDLVKVWYQAGNQDDDYIAGYTLDPLSDFWAVTIAMLATAKLERDICACNNALTLARHWMTDIAFTGNDTSYITDFEILGNPFGTKMGELEAWRRCRSFNVRTFDAGLI